MNETESEEKYLEIIKESEEKVIEIIANALTQKEPITPKDEKKIREDIFNVLKKKDIIFDPEKLADRMMDAYRYLKFKSFKTKHDNF